MPRLIRVILATIIVGILFATACVSDVIADISCKGNVQVVQDTILYSYLVCSGK